MDISREGQEKSISREMELAFYLLYIYSKKKKRSSIFSASFFDKRDHASQTMIHRLVGE